MANEGHSNKDDVHQVREATEESVRDLLSEFDELLSLTLSLKEEKARLEAQIASLRDGEAEGGNGAACCAVTARHIEVEQLYANIANLYVASHRIHASLERERVLAAIEEVIVNQIGSEDFAIFELEDDGARLSLVACLGAVDAQLFETAVIIDVLESGSIYVRGAVPGEPPDSPVACIPLKVGNSVTGVIVIRTLLCHKERLDPPDHELCSLLMTHGGVALYSSRLYARAKAEEQKQ